MTTFSGNRVLAEGRKFDIGTNVVPTFSFVEDGTGETWLNAKFVGEDGQEPLFNGRLFHSAGDGQTTVIDNFPKSDVPHGWEKRVSLDADGYELVDDLGQVIFSYRDTGEGHVKVTVKLYGPGGQVAAYTTDESLEVNGMNFTM